MNKNNNVLIVMFLLLILLIVLIINVIIHVKIYVVYSSGVGPIFLIGLIIFLIALFYFKG
ncbi:MULTISPECIES: hypothetical protein [Neobacillus]|uniref:Uncharacterized protein n=1 Tax=Neobacillus rhizophilus TaxID=2833579 RepID=A0A942U7U4_9BACI|nr:MULTISPECIES: hypothetical protein [Neobacillus]MBS4214537.1 hypothetical protein [Neobacillus rhizophilus]MBU8918441.1 hypothetical protein [Bacillus sp. FJAT-29953]